MRILVMEGATRESVIQEKSRNRWIVVVIVAAVAALLLACLIGCLTASLGLGLFVNRSVEGMDGTARVQDREERSYAVGLSPKVSVDNFAGKVTVRYPTARTRPVAP